MLHGELRKGFERRGNQQIKEQEIYTEISTRVDFDSDKISREGILT